MARIRTMKPDFFTHPEVVAVSIPARLLLLSLLTQADDDGRLYLQPRKIAGLAFGENDRVKVDRLLEELAASDRICTYEADGKGCLHIPKFREHQVINRPTSSRIPPCPVHDDSPTTPGVLSESSRPEVEVEVEREVEQGTPPTPPGEIEWEIEFDAFWRVYPRREDKNRARKAFRAARKQASIKAIISGAERYRDDPNRSAEYTKLPTTWLNAGSWDNGPLPERGGLTADAISDFLRAEGVR